LALTPYPPAPMPHRCLFAAVALLSANPTAPAVDPSELKPGLIVSFTGPENELGTAITRLDPTVALTLAPGETAHPRMPRLATARWRGHLNVVRPGKYTFSATLRGRLVVTVGGRTVFDAENTGEAKSVTGAEVALAGGVQPFEAVFTIPAAGAARVELLWEGPGFVREPVPHQFLGHLPDDRPPTLARTTELERGRFAFEELACARCHKPDANDRMAKGLADRTGPNLTDVAKRSYAGWLDAWLADPARLRPHTAMPAMFADTEAGRAERYAVVAYLVSIAGGSPLEPSRAPTISGEYRQSMERGRVLFTVTGCAACHQEPQPRKAARNDEDEKPPLRPEDFLYGLGTPEGPAAKYSLGALGSKYRPETLAAYLRDPLKVNPSGRMPHMVLDSREALDLARYLCRVTDETLSTAMPAAGGLRPALISGEVFATSGTTADQYAAFKKLPAERQWVELGRRLVVTKGCVNCHAVEPGGKPVEPAAVFPSLAEIRKAGGASGCLTPDPHADKAPEYKLDANASAALAAFLKDGLTGAGSPAPTHAARVALKRFNCLNCHSKDGEGGIPAELADAMRLMERAENADDVRPPLLTGIGHKARTSWLKAVLTQGGRARPWMQLRMPQYGPQNVGGLPEALAFLEGTLPDDTVRKVPLDAERIAAGKAIVGKGGLGCISCHDISGVPNTGTRGPDLATIDQRVRFDWYTRWLHQPLRMAPGTRMPQAFVDGKSTLATVYKGDADAQAEAMWAYLSLGPGLPLPEGMEPPRGVVLAVKDRPELLRTFLPDAGTKAIAVGYPGNVSVAFSADQCRLAYAWAGNFLDASPVWNNRGGSPAKLLGPRFWVAPPGHPWGLTASLHIPPDFLGRANHPAFGTPLPLEPARVYDGPPAVGFDGYTLDRDGRPTFRYHLAGNRNAILKVAETPSPLNATVAAGVQRQFAVEVPGGYQAWFLAGVTAREPRVIGAGGPVAISARGTVPVARTRLVLPADGDRATVLEVTDAPDGTAWRFEAAPAGGWLAIVRLPGSEGPLKAKLTLTVWGLPKDDDALLKGLAAK
jgi:mono/diheme cytochrome c family protein